MKEQLEGMVKELDVGVDLVVQALSDAVRLDLLESHLKVKGYDLEAYMNDSDIPFDEKVDLDELNFSAEKSMFDAARVAKYVNLSKMRVVYDAAKRVYESHSPRGFRPKTLDAVYAFLAGCSRA